MEQYVCNSYFHFDEINALNHESNFDKGCYIVIIHSDKIPPHLGILVDHLFFSHKVNGIDFDVPLNLLLSTLNKRNISTLFVQLKQRERWSLEAIRTCFSGDSFDIDKDKTCLNPLINIIQPTENCKVLADLLNYLNDKDLIEGCIGLNLPDDYQGIPYYTSEDVLKRLKEINNVRRR